jgi:ArsR family transcriptional regulator
VITLQKEAVRAAALASIISNETRVSIILFLQEKQGAYVQEIAEALDMSQSAISHQLSLLLEGGVVSSKKEGRDVFYALSRKQQTQRLLKALRCL